MATDIRTNVGRKAALRSAGMVSQHGWKVGGFIGGITEGMVGRVATCPSKYCPQYIITESVFG
jgi:hypothetical protein